MQHFLKTTLTQLKILRHLNESIGVFFRQKNTTVYSDAADFWDTKNPGESTKDFSHWADHGRWRDTQAWRAIGMQHYQMFQRLCRLAHYELPIERMVEWGPGGGANAVHFCSSVKDYFGVDISIANLEECERQLQTRGNCTFHKVLINIGSPERSTHSINQQVDFFLSTAVYQHFPDKNYGIKVTQLASEMLKPRGIALIQIRYDDGSWWVRSRYRNYRKNAIVFTSYTIDEFWQILESTGLQPIAVTLQPNNKYAYYYAMKE